ncbi:MAG: hypothetical protein K2M63_11345 [Muribaculaceae bacterium]|nr:hypothetical protein [Muribaculaceae bacterium]
MRGITDNIYGKGITYLIVLSLLVALCHGCSTLGNDLPSDEEMLNTFHVKEATFNEMVQIFQEFPSWEGDKPGGYGYRDGYWPDSAESRAFFGEELALRIDSLLKEMGCENVHFWYARSDASADTIHPNKYAFISSADGLSIGPGISKEFVYCVNPIDSLELKCEICYMEDKPSSVFVTDGDLDSLYHDIRTKANEREERILFIKLRRRIADNWLIELEYSH